MRALGHFCLTWQIAYHCPRQISCSRPALPVFNVSPNKNHLSCLDEGKITFPKYEEGQLPFCSLCTLCTYMAILWHVEICSRGPYHLKDKSLDQHHYFELTRCPCTAPWFLGLLFVILLWERAWLNENQGRALAQVQHSCKELLPLSISSSSARGGAVGLWLSWEAAQLGADFEDVNEF